MSQKEQTKSREQRLPDAFSSQEWDDIKEEIKACLNNSNAVLKAKGNKTREFDAGACWGIETVLRLEQKYKNETS